MKKLFSAMLIVINLSAFGQTKETTINKMYLQLGTGASSYKGISGEVAIQAVFKNNWISSFSYNSLTMDPKNVPSDYRPGYTTVLFISYDNSPTVTMDVYSLTTGKYFKTGRNTWFSTEAGLSYVNGEKVNYTRNAGNLSGWNLIFIGEEPSNYNTTVEKQATMGGVLKADFNWAFASVAALGAGFNTNLNPLQSTVGFEVKLSLGWMNVKKKGSRH
jgi:hypothetical protein